MNKPPRLAAILSLIVAAFAVYWPSLRNGFVWDDTALVMRDPLIRSWRLIPEGFRHFLFTDATASNFYRPLQRLTYVLDYALYAFRPYGYHLTNILIHAAAAVALFFCLRALIMRAEPAAEPRAGLLAWIASFAWVIHPVHTAAVCYVSGRADELAAFFGFSALYFVASEKPRRLHGWLASACFLAALLSKESGITALLIWFVALLCLRDFRRLRGWLLASVGILAIYCAFRFTAEHTPPPDEPPFSLAARPILMMRAWAEYAGLLIAPVNLHMERTLLVMPHQPEMEGVADATRRDFQTVIGLLLIVAFIFWARWAGRRSPATRFFLFAFVVAYLPTSNLFSLNSTAAEHWLYFSSAFLFAAVALSLSSLPVPQRAVAVALTLWLASFAARTFIRNYDWRDQRTFLTSTIVCGGEPARPLINLGLLESSEGHQKAAVVCFQEALRERPDQPFALLGLARAYWLEQDYKDARAQLQRARINPFIYPQAIESIAILDNLENHVDNIALLTKAASLAPDNWEIQQRYIKHLAERRQLDQAVAVMKAVLSTQDYRSDSWKLMGDLMTQAGDPEKAQYAYQRAAECDVHFRR